MFPIASLFALVCSMDDDVQMNQRLLTTFDGMFVNRPGESLPARAKFENSVRFFVRSLKMLSILLQRIRLYELWTCREFVERIRPNESVQELFSFECTMKAERCRITEKLRSPCSGQCSHLGPEWNTSVCSDMSSDDESADFSIMKNRW